MEIIGVSAIAIVLKEPTGVNPAISMVYVGCCLSQSPNSLLDTAGSSSSKPAEATDLVLRLCSGTVRDACDPWTSSTPKILESSESS